ncbi:MAG: sugar-binding protein [Capsulimonadaceae bacterium]|nr:sugar-binding protein [Capsulimonadaceae bacterium]
MNGSMVRQFQHLLGFAASFPRTWAVRTALALLTISACALAHADATYRVFDTANYTRVGELTPYDCKFDSPAEGRNGVVEYNPAKWSALIFKLPIGRIEGAKFILHLKYRWVGDTANSPSGGIWMGFEDTDHKDMNLSASKPIAFDREWREVTDEIVVPKGASVARCDLSSAAKGGGSLEIGAYDLTMSGVDLSTLADRAIALPWLKVPGGNASAPPLGENSGVAQYTEANPFSFDSPAWSKATSYDIPATSCNKTPPGDVAANFRMLWTNDALFVRYHAHDHILNFKADSIFLRDCFEFFLETTGHLGSEGDDMKFKEQYTVSRDRTGNTSVRAGNMSANLPALTRLTDDGWDAIIEIPLRTEDRRITPFNGLSLTFNAVYQDANSIPQEHWLSFSKKDQVNESWCKPDLYAPLVFATEEARDYSPLWLGSEKGVYNVEPKFAGRFNLIRSEASPENFTCWERPDVPVKAYKEDGHNVVRFTFKNYPDQPRGFIATSPFNVLRGETLTFDLDARVVSGARANLPEILYLSQENWVGIGGNFTAPNITPQWSHYIGTLKLTDKCVDNLRNGRLLINFGVQPGRVIEIRDLRLTHRTPVDFDAKISTPGLYSHFWNGERNTVLFDFASDVPVSAKVSAEVDDFFTGKALASKEWSRSFASGANHLDWDVSSLPNGFFNVVLKVRGADGGFLADRELYISKGIKNTRHSQFCCQWFGSAIDLPAPREYPELTAMLHNIGINRVLFADLNLFDSRGNDDAACTIQYLKALKLAGFEVAGLLQRSGAHDIKRPWQPDELDDYYEKSLKLTRGCFDILGFANEPNLWWDSREWAISHRGFYNAVKRYAPSTKPIIGALNSLPIDYMKSAAQQNGNSFADGVVGVHLYGIEPNEDGAFNNLIEKRRDIDDIHPGWDCWDTESGMVNHSIRSILDLKSKIEPLFRCAGYTRSYLYWESETLFPLGDSTPLLPMEAFENRFFLDTTPVGRVTIAGGKVHVYLFRRADGQGAAVLWNASHDDVQADVPLGGPGTVYDMFGNVESAGAKARAHIALGDSWVRYINGVDLGALKTSSTFAAAFKSKAVTPARDVDAVQDVYLSLPYVTRALDRQVEAGHASTITFSLRNASDSPHLANLTADAPPKMTATFESGKSSFHLAPRETVLVRVSLLASTDVSLSSLRIGGNVDGKLKLLPIVYSVKTAPAIVVSGYTRAVVARNNSSSAAKFAVTCEKQFMFFDPGMIRFSLDAGAGAAEPLHVTQKPENVPYNSPQTYQLNVSGANEPLTADGKSILFSPQDDTPVEMTHLPCSAVPEQPGSEPFQAEYRLSWTEQGLRIVARVHDESPVQEGQAGFLKTGGDCLIVAVDADTGARPIKFGDGYCEYGFAMGPHGPTAYSWNGKNGLEAASNFPEGIRALERDAQYIYYDVVIPLDKLFPLPSSGNAGLSIAFVNKSKSSETQKIELGEGILPDRDPAKMGELIRRR